ncbi:hypothetical protein ELG64_09015 [Rhizobium leguminosarum]|uniref:portal protein n=1 Tax=Rhizobium leguminosarum TaxID=384 RepID=UPI001030F025|nr:hypothetical protein [Rhizobium leguminosarum]TBH23634.1 hypothetical protein ELG64_09015 [Rhizobium leguminosarum]
MYCAFFDEAAEAFDFDEGKQWTEEEEDDLRANGLVPYVSNQIQPRIDNVSGSEVLTRTRLKFDARSMSETALSSADALTDLILYLQENNSSSSKWSQAMRKARVCGLAWHHILPNNDTIEEEIPSSLDVVYDPLDMTMGFTNSRGRGLIGWYTRDELLRKYPGKVAEVDAATSSHNGIGGIYTNMMAPKGVTSSRMTFSRCGYFDKSSKKVMLVRFYYRVPKAFYTYLSKENLIVNTFYKAEAEKESSKKRGGYSKNDGYQLRCCVFSGSVVFDEFEYPYQLDYYRGAIPLTPICLKREENTGIPYGMVRAAKDDQKLYNKKMSKLNWYLSSRQVIMDSNAVDDVDNLAAEVARPDGIIMKRRGADLAIQKNLDEIASHYQSLDIHVRNIERNMAVFDEATGAETNATSGRAIQLRKSGSQTTQALPIDLLRLAKREAGRKMAQMAQMKFDDRMVFTIRGSDGKPQQRAINAPVEEADGKPKKDPDGNIVRQADIRGLNFDVTLEEAPDVATINEDAKQRLADMISQGANVQSLTPGMLKTLGIPEENELYQEISQGFQQKIQQADAILKENEGLKAQLAKLTGQQIQGGNAPSMPAGGVPGNVQ